MKLKNRLLAFATSTMMIMSIMPATVWAEDSEVDHIELITPTEYKFIENYYGNYEIDDNGEEYFYYYYAGMDNIYFNDAQIEIFYKDGTSTVGNVDYFYVDGYEIEVEDNQDKNHWKLGDDNVVTISYRGCETTMNVSVIENPVDHIEVEKASEYKIKENEGGDFDVDDNGESFYFYYLITKWGETNLIGDAQIKIIYKDGTTQIANVGEYVNGYEVICDNSTQYEKHWTVGNDNEVILSYLGKTVSTYVTVVDSEQGLLGDIFSDGKIDNDDLEIFAKYLAGWNIEENVDTSAMDLNGDGVVNSKDRTILARHIAGWENYDELPFKV